tara:strand:+ start:734 stop:2260 length:1527 start_codon:yes stop_codon:yes gene_type:complete
MIVERFNISKYRGIWKYPNSLIIHPKMLPNNDGDNINGASLIKVPDWIKNPLGKYYLYFAHHKGKYIRMAYSDSVAGPYTVYEPGTLKLENTPGNDHIASPDVHIDDINKEIIMYYHTPYDDWQYTFKSTSKNGIDFKSDSKKLGMFYFRVFKWNGRIFSVAKNRNTSGITYELINDEWVVQRDDFIPNIRHCAVLVEDGNVFIFYSVVGEAPESIYYSKVDIDNNWQLTDTKLLIKPTYNYEGSDLPLRPSKFGSGIGNELRDPCIFVDGNIKYLLYSVVGEAGIAISKLHNTTSNLKKYNVWGMRRCGNHAIIEWISKHFEGTLHNNDIIQNKPWLIKMYGNCNFVECHIDSYEDFPPEIVDKNTIIILRDWYNMCASRLISGRGWKHSCRYDDTHGYVRSCEEVYLQYCKLWEKYPNNFIIYNKWCTDIDYQKEIENKYGWCRVNRTDNMPESGIGNGSSFEHTELSFDTRYLDVMEKYPNEWVEICSNKKINDYSKIIFGIEVQ